MITLYIPTKNSSAYLLRVLKAVTHMKEIKRINEILIIDKSNKIEYKKINEITDRIKNTLSESTKIKVIKQKNNGLASARNIAVKESKNNIIASLDSDCIPDKNWLTQLLKTMEKENAVGVGGRVIELKKLERTSLADEWRAIHLKQGFGCKKLINPPFLSGSNALFIKKKLEEIGFYNEKYKTNYEDVDISKRLMKKGYKLVYEPKAIVYHIKKDTIRSVLKTSWAWSFYGNEPTTLTKIFKRILFNFYKTVKYLFEDFINLRLKFLVIDLLILPTHFYYDIRWLSTNKKFIRKKTKSYEMHNFIILYYPR